MDLQDHLVKAGPPGQAGKPGESGQDGKNGGGNVVTFQPGGVASGTTFTDFASLSTYISSISTSIDRWIIQVDGSFTGGSPSIASGTYALPSSVTFVGLANVSVPENYPTLSGDSVVFSPIPLEVTFLNIPFIQINNLSLTPVFTVDGSVGSGVMFMYLTGVTILSGFGPFVAVVNNGQLFSRAYTCASFGQTPGPVGTVLSVDATSFSSLGLFDSSGLASGALSVASGGTFNVHVVDSAHLDPSFLTAPTVNIDLRSLVCQSGTTTLVLGVSPSVTATLTPTSRIVMSYADTSTATNLGVLVAESSDRVVGAPGSFVIRSLSLTKTAVTTDTSTVEWHITNH